MFLNKSSKRGLISCEWGLSSKLTVDSHQGGLSSGWSLVKVVSHQGGLLSRWSLIKVVSCQGGLSSGWSPIRVVSHQGGLLSGVLLYFTYSHKGQRETLVCVCLKKEVLLFVFLHLTL